MKALPQLGGCDNEIRRRLSESLIYRRNQLNNTKYWKRAKMVFINAGYLIPYFWYFMQLNVIKYILGYNHVINYNIHHK